MIITIAAQKGGVSKTTTAAAIAQALTYKRKIALLLDLDAQRSASLIYGADEGGTGGTYSLITGQAPAEDLMQETPAGNIIPASPLLHRLDPFQSEDSQRRSLFCHTPLPAQPRAPATRRQRQLRQLDLFLLKSKKYERHQEQR